MPEAPQENSNQGSSIFSPLPSLSETPVAADSSGQKQSKRTLVIGASLVVLMLILVGVTFYSLRSSSSASPSPTPPPAASQQPLSDQGLDQSVSQVNSDFSSIDKEVSGVDSGLNDKSPDLSY